jgi:(heptosyl)LPS beta-1,4-glucosyltransferase
MSVAAIVITKNEEANIEGCLNSLRWVDELIVVDAESTDRTVTLANQYTQHVFVRPWPGYGPQKNFAMAQSGADWALIVDADERVSSDLREEIRGVLNRGDETAAYRIPRRNFYYGQWLRHAGQYPDRQLRLVRRAQARYNDLPVHEHLIVAGVAADLESPLDHYTHPTVLSHEVKIDRYSTLAVQELRQARGGDVRWHHLIVNPFWTFLKLYFMKRGYRDGLSGLVFSLFSAAHVLLKYAKLWEATLPPAPITKPSWNQ